MEQSPFSRGYTYHTYSVNTVALSPDGKHVAFGGWDETVQVNDLVEGGRALTYKGHIDTVQAVAWSPNGRCLVSAFGGESTGDVQVWNADTGETICTHTGYSSLVRSVQWSPDGKHIASASKDGTVRVWSRDDRPPDDRRRFGYIRIL
jgi:WD40 repeat protein